MGGWVFVYQNVAAKRVHKEGIYKHAEKHPINAQNLYRGMLTSSVVSTLVFFIEAGKSESSVPMHSHLGQL